MIKNESVVNNIDNKKLEEFSVDGYHRKCFDEGDHDYIDQSFLKLLEYNTDEFEQNLSNHFLDLIYEKDRIVYSDLMSKLKTGEFSGKIQYRIKTKSGKYLVVEENFKSLISCSGKIWCLGIVKRINYNNSEDLFKAKCEMIKDEDAPYGIMRCSFEEYPRIEYMNSCMMRFIGASIFNEYKLYAENIFFMISHLYRDKFREILSGLSTFSDPVFISHNIVKINGSNLFLNGWGWVEYNENKEKQFCFFYGLPASAYNEDKNEGDFISSLKPSYNLISLCSLTARNGYEVIFQLQQH